MQTENLKTIKMVLSDDEISTLKNASEIVNTILEQINNPAIIVETDVDQTEYLYENDLIEVWHALNTLGNSISIRTSIENIDE